MNLIISPERHTRQGKPATPHIFWQDLHNFQDTYILFFILLILSEYWGLKLYKPKKKSSNFFLLWQLIFQWMSPFFYIFGYKRKAGQCVGWTLPTLHCNFLIFQGVPLYVGGLILHFRNVLISTVPSLKNQFAGNTGGDSRHGITSTHFILFVSNIIDIVRAWF